MPRKRTSLPALHIVASFNIAGLEHAALSPSMDISTAKVTEAYPIELHHIRALFLRKQHRRCITACRDLINNGATALKDQPLRRTFIRFYLALAHDELARTIHSYSRTKLSAIRLAEQLYRDATLSLPTAEQCAEAVTTPIPTNETTNDAEPSRAVDIHSPSVRSSTDSISDGPPEPIYSPLPKNMQRDSYPPRSPPVDSPLAALSDQEDDLESHASFNQIMTPNRLPKLQRDYSSMSLIQAQDAPPSQASTGYGAPAAQQHPPTRPTYSGKPQTPSRLPRLNTTSLASSPVRKQLRTPSEQASPVDSPVSPLGSGSVASDASTISPISPSTPVAGFDNSRTAAQSKLRAFEDHLAALRNQIDRHIELLEEEGQRIISLQAERSTLTSSIGGVAEGTIPPLPASQSFWSFTPTNVKECEKRNRITAGRQRGWQRKRFDPTKYQRLAEMAIQEL